MNGLSRRELLLQAALATGAVALAPLRGRAAAPGAVMTALSEYMAAAKERALPGAIVEHTVHHVLDTVAAMVSGAALPPGRAALALARAEAGRPVATVAASDIVTGAADAALVNGVLAHSDETDDSHSASQSHPGASIVPAALAMGEQLGISGRHYLRAVTLLTSSALNGRPFMIDWSASSGA
jgi:2-methylcitrate dehydratase PrpD